MVNMSKSDKAKFVAEVHHRVVRKFPRRHVFVTGLDEIWAMDLISYETDVKANDGYRYILCVIDVFSKFAWCVPLKSKSASTVLQSVKDIVLKSHRSPQKIWVDRGSEFYNKEFKDWINSKNISMYSTYGESKSVVVERFIRTLKTMISKAFTLKNTHTWVPLLPTLVKKYNSTTHSSTKFTPIHASDPTNEVKVYINVNKADAKPDTKPKFKVGDQVRISRIKRTFAKGYEHNFSYEVFTVKEVLNTNPITYKLTEFDGSPIEGSFYASEMIKTAVPDYYEVEKVLKTRKVGNKTESLVKWKGWPDKYNSWIAESQIYNVPTK
jgi:hypothetical protein